MGAEAVIDAALEAALARADQGVAPGRLIAAMRHAVFPGGARVRPRLCLAVAHACGAPIASTTVAAAASIELMHCASLVHDDLPCFDDADTRRGLPSVHVAFGQPIAVLTGDALIVQAFETVANAEAMSPALAVSLTQILARSAGSPLGIAAGQAWESEFAVELDAYQRAKTSALFIAACEAGAAVGNAVPSEWSRFGSELGLAYQAADDLRDKLASAAEIGKPIGKDSQFNRPSVVEERGVAGAIKRLEVLVLRAKEAIPACPGRQELRNLVDGEMSRLMPQELFERAA